MPFGPGHSVNLGRIEQLDGSGPHGISAGPDQQAGFEGQRGPHGREGARSAAVTGEAVHALSASHPGEGSLAQLVPGGGESTPNPAEALIGIDDVQKALNRSRASVYRYTNTDPRNLNPPFNPRRLNPEYRSDQKDPLLFHPNEVARFARDVLRIKEVTVEVLNSPSTATQQLLGSILDELRTIRQRLERLDPQPGLHHETSSRFEQHSRPAA
jgi:hypothetical protein